MTMPVIGTVALVGAGEFLPKMLPVDKMLLEHVGNVPRVAVVPTAAAPDGPAVAERWANKGVKHFSQLGVAVEPVMLLKRSDADNAAIVAQIAAANFVYLSGGKTRYLLEALKGTAAWEAIAKVFVAGGVIAGCSAGAMVLGGSVLDFPLLWRTLPGLGLAPNTTVIPHFNQVPALLPSIIHLIQRKTTLIGIDGGTALVGSSREWRVYGRNSVTVFAGRQKRRYLAGEQVLLPQSG